jgi:hypothetical protein
MHPSIGHINDELAIATETARKGKRLQAKLTSRQSDIGRLRPAEKKLRLLLESEIDDVETLRGMTFKNLIATVSRQKEKWQQKEWQEYLDAKWRHDESYEALEQAENEVERLQAELTQLGDWQAKLTELFAQKGQLLISTSDPRAAQLIALNLETTELKADQVELEEAIKAGVGALQALTEMSSQLSTASNWGVWDMVGGGMISSIMKHSNIDKARAKAQQAQRKLIDFKTELADVGARLEGSVEIGGTAKMVDVFFDNIFVDWMVQSRIKEAQKQSAGTIKKVERLLSDCKMRQVDGRQALLDLEQRHRELLD